MSQWLNLLIGLALGMNLLALASGRLPSLIRSAAGQGVILGILPLVLGHHSWLTLGFALCTVLVKGILIPGLLRRALRTSHMEREIRPIIGFIPSLLLGAGATIASVGLADTMPLLPRHAGSLLAAGAFATLFTGFLLLIGRAKAIAQVCGYLILENGIFLFGLLLIGSTPLIVEAGILLDLTVAVFVIGIIVDRIQREFDTLDTRELTALKE